MFLSVLSKILDSRHRIVQNNKIDQIGKIHVWSIFVNYLFDNFILEVCLCVVVLVCGNGKVGGRYIILDLILLDSKL